MIDHKPHISPKKKQEVEQIKKLFLEYPVVGIADLRDLPAANLQRMKKSLREKAVFIIPKRRRALIAVDELKDTLPNAQELRSKLQGMIALLFSKDDPFKLYKVVQKNISPAAAKAGQTSPEDITIPAGPTQFMAGPMIGELGQLGLKTEVKEGKIAIKEDKVIVKQGQIITQKVAELLTKFGIEPMKIGLNVLYTYQKGEILGKEILGVSEEEYIGFIQTSHRESLNLAVFIAYPSKDTIELLIQKAAREGKGLADSIKFEENKPTEASQQTPPEQPKEEPKQPEQKQQPQKVQKLEPVKEPPKPLPQEAQKEEHKPTPQLQQTPKPAPKKETKTDEQVAQEVLKRLQDEKLKQQRPMEQPKKDDEKRHVIEKEEKDLNKIINTLKDKKSKGQL